MPFNDLEAMPRIFGEFRLEGSFYPVAFGIVFAGIGLLLNPRLSKPKHISFKMFLFFLAWVLISGTINCLTIAEVCTKGRTGIEKFILQAIVLLFVFFTTLLGYNVAVKVWKDRTLEIIRRAILLSFIIAGAYSLIEIQYLLGASWAGKALVGLNSLFRNDTALYPRLRSVCGEASWFGSYFSFVYPWLLSYLFQVKRGFLLYLCIVGYALAMVYLSLSRTAYFIMVAETFLFILLMITKNMTRKVKTQLLVFLFVLVGLGFIVHFIPSPTKSLQVIKSFVVKDTSYKLSNIGRFGSSFAGLRMGYANPIAGVGLGQYGFHMPEYTPSWAYASEEIKSWASTSPDTPWAPVNNIHVRIFAELGAVGLMLWLSIWGTSLISSFRITRKFRYYNPEKKISSIVLTVSIFGLILSGFNFDSFRFMAYWFLLAIVWASHELPVFTALHKNCGELK
jgi:hypothetical protein